jgi:ribosomal protein S18 acetylase RimI-like enzyme
VRPARAADAPDIGRVLASGFGDKFTTILGRRAAHAPALLAGLTEMRLARGLATTFVAERDTRVVGVLNIEARREGMGDRWAEFQVFLREVGPLTTLRSVIGVVLLNDEVVPADEAYISELAVASGCRRQGLGTLLLTRVAAWARSVGRQRLSLHVAISNPARRLYQRVGFRLARCQEAHLAERLFGIEAWLYMVKPLCGLDG